MPPISHDPTRRYRSAYCRVESLTNQLFDLGGHADGAPEDSVAAFFSKLVDSWKNNDGAAFADDFIEDGSLINPFGERADGKAALTAMDSEYFAGMSQARPPQSIWPPSGLSRRSSSWWTRS